MPTTEHAIEAPPKLTFADVSIPKGKRHSIDLSYGTDDYWDVVAVLQAYWKQATRLTDDELIEMERIIRSGTFLRTRSVRGAAGCHAFYRAATEKRLHPDHISWPRFICLNALYGDKVPDNLEDAVRKKFGTIRVKDWSDKYHEFHPLEDHPFPEDPDAPKSAEPQTKTSANTNDSKRQWEDSSSDDSERQETSQSPPEREETSPSPKGEAS